MRSLRVDESFESSLSWVPRGLLFKDRDGGGCSLSVLFASDEDIVRKGVVMGDEVKNYLFIEK